MGWKENELEDFVGEMPLISIFYARFDNDKGAILGIRALAYFYP